MKTLSVTKLCTIVLGELIQGEEVSIWYGAYRLKQVKNKNTVLYSHNQMLLSLKDSWQLYL